jgi:hypothetical protein
MVYVLFGSMIFEFWHPLLRLPPKTTKILNIEKKPPPFWIGYQSTWQAIDQKLAERTRYFNNKEISR